MLERSKILVVDNDQAVVRLTKLTLELAGFQVEVASSGRTALERFKLDAPDMVILEMCLPDLSGLEIGQRIRQQSFTVLIIMVSMMNGDDDLEAGLEAGADDYIAKPFSAAVLAARVKAALRRIKQADLHNKGSVFQVGMFTVDLEDRRISLRGKTLPLAPTELRLFTVLLRYPGRLVTPIQLLSAVWGLEDVGHLHLLRIAVNRLREKVEDDPRNPTIVKTEYGFGYQLHPG